MKRTFWFLALATAATAGACYYPYDNYYAPLTDPALATGGSGGGTTTTVPSNCIPSNTSSPVDDSCGVFVSSSKGKDGNKGTKEDPLATIAHAIEIANGRPIYLCAESFTEALALKNDATFYGGLDCTTDWKHVGPDKKTMWTAKADEAPLHVVTGARATLEDIALASVDATKPGGSSIAIVAEAGTQLDLSRCDVSAGNGALGAKGDTPSGSGMAGAIGKDGSGSCTSDQGEFGGSGGQLMCDAANVAGGDGGNGSKNVTGGAGSPGQPLDAMTGKAGLGQGVAMSCAMDGNGGDGTTGAPGDPGLGAPASPGALSPEGYTGAAGKDGGTGKPGQGAGGGGGGKACANGKAGPSGGGGGSAGCAGTGGKGGGGGGASIGIVSLGSKLTLATVTISTKNGGNGGNGGDGQPGGKGGDGGMPGKAENGGSGAAACAGGKGGDGGVGGKGGGGRGGPSIGIAFTGDKPDTTAATITVGKPGNGGTGDGDKGTGAAGVAQDVQTF